MVAPAGTFPYRRKVATRDHVRQAEILVEALPYIRQFAGKVVVVKYGGNAMTDDTLKQAFAHDIVLLKYVGIHPVVVHGGGPQIDRMLAQLDIQPSFVRGLRVTDATTMRVVEMVLAGEISGEIVTAIQRAGGRAVGCTGKDGGLIVARRHAPSAADDDLGQVGEIVRRRSGPDPRLAGARLHPGDRSGRREQRGREPQHQRGHGGGQIAEALAAEKLFLLTDVDGIRDAAATLIPSARRERGRRADREWRGDARA